MDDDEAETEGDDRGQYRRSPAEHHVLAATECLRHAVQARTDDGGNGEQERVTGRGRTIEAHEPTGHDRAAGT